MNEVVDSYRGIENNISIQEVFKIISSYKFQILSFTIALVMITVVIVFSIKPTYQGTAVLYIEQEKAKVVSIDEVYGLDAGNDSYLNTQYETIKSRTVLEKVVLKLDLINNPEFNDHLKNNNSIRKFFGWMDFRNWIGIQLPDDVDDYELQLRDVINNVSDAIRVEPVRKTQIVKIHAKSTNRRLAAEIANQVGMSYIENYLESKLSLNLNATSWMKSRMNELSLNLKKAEINLQDYRDKEKLVDVEGVLTIVSNEIKALMQSLIEVKQKLVTSENITKLVSENRNKKSVDLESMPAVLAHPVIRDLKSEEVRLERQLQELSKRYGPKHPKMISAKSELVSIRENIRLQVTRILKGIESEYEVDKANEKRISEALDKAKEQVQVINKKQFQLLAFEREVQTNKELYDAFFKRIQETDATNDIHLANARILDKAFLPEKPIKPKKVLIISLVGLLSLIFSCGVALLLDVLNNTVRSVSSVENNLNLPVLGVIPKQEDSINDKLPTLFLDRDHHVFAEAIRTIRTSLCLKGLNSKSKIFSVTSTQPGEGKSSLASNLSLSFGQLGKTLLIDCDMRRPKVGSNFRVKGGNPGLSSLIAGHVDKKECIQNIESIDILAAGVIPPNPQELLSNERFKKLIKELSDEYEFIVLDCPPVSSVSDALMISKASDGVIYVIESGVTQLSAIKLCAGRLFSADISISGVVLSKINPNNKGNYDGYYDYYSYSDSC